MRNHAKEITARCLITDINTTLFSAHLGMPPSALAFSGRPSLISHLGMPPSASAFSGRPSLFIFPSQYSLEISHALYLLGVMHTRTVSELSPPAKTCKSHTIPRKLIQISPVPETRQAEPSQFETKYSAALCCATMHTRTDAEPPVTPSMQVWSGSS